MNEEKARKIIHFRPLFYGFVSMLFALLTTRFVFSGQIVYIVLDLVVVLGLSIYLLLKKKVIALIVLSCLFLFGMGWYFVGIATFEGKTYSSVVEVTGRVCDDLTQNSTRGVVTLKNVTINGEKEKNLRLYYTVESDTLSVGDIVKFSGYVKKVKTFELGSFNSSLYRKRIAYTASVKESDLAVTGQKILLAEKFRMRVQKLLYDKMGAENGAVAYAVLFGDKSGIDGDITNTYKTAGIVHLLTISGLHISFLIALLGFVLKKCKVKGWVNLLIITIFVFVYSYLCGFSPAVLRASIMGLVLVFAQVSGKCYDKLNALGFAGIILLGVSPLSAYDVGFLMSFASVFAIFVLMPQISKWLNKIMPKWSADAISVTLSAQIGILPFVSKISGTINFLSVFTNLIVVPIFSVLYPFLFVMVFVSLILPFMSFMLTLCGWGFELLYQIAKIMSVKALTVSLKPISIYVSVAFFVLIFTLGRYFMVNKKVRLISFGVLFAVTSALFGLNLTNFASEASVSVCYSGYYSTILLTNNDRKSVIIDTEEGAFAAEAMRANNIAKVSALVCLNHQQVDGTKILQTKVPFVVKAENGYCKGNDVCKEWDVGFSVQGFDFKYVSKGDKLVGLEVTFDTTKLFVVKSGAQEADLSDVKSNDYNFVIVGKNKNVAQAFISAGSIIGYYSSQSVDCSYVKDGNFAYKVSKNGYVWRSLD